MSKYYDDNPVDNPSDSDDGLCEKGQYLKENFTLEDFLEFSKTKEILDQNHLWKFERNCEVILEKFYKAEVDFCQGDLSTLFNNETGYENRGYFEAVVFNHVKPKYDLELLYDNPSFCNSFIEFHDKKVAENIAERLRLQRENYNKTENAGKKFDWSPKTYK